MPGRDEEINELLSTVSKLSEVAARNHLSFATHLLDMLQLELTMVMFGYSDAGDGEANDPPGKPAGRSRPASKRSRVRGRGRRA